MVVAGIDRRGELTRRGRAAALAVAELVASLTPDTASRSVPGMDWTAVETAVHIVTLYRRALGDLRRSDSPEGTAGLNAQCIAEWEERDPAHLAERIAVDSVTAWDEVFPSLPDDLPIPFHAGVTATIVPIMGVVLMEMLVHGDDIARASGGSWSIADGDAWCALGALAPLLPAWRSKGVSPVGPIALVGPGEEAIRISIEVDGAVVGEGAIREGDQVVEEAPAMALLGLFGRRPASGALADLAERFGPF